MTDNIILNIEKNERLGTISVYRAGVEFPILTQNANSGHRPYLHPIIAPDGNGSITEYSPGHHKHQTGLYWGFTRINGNNNLIPENKLLDWFYSRDYKQFKKSDGTWDKTERSPEKKKEIAKAVGRDYFHNYGPEYWQLESATVLHPHGKEVSWKTVYNMLDGDGKTIMIETQKWIMKIVDGNYILDLEWMGHAKIDITINKFDYGGMFLRMPWKEGVRAEVINASKHRDLEAEGQRAKWLDIGLQIEGRDDLAHIAIFDHNGNSGYPTPWRVDGQFGVGPSQAINNDWSINNGDSEIINHQLIVYTGELEINKMNEMWDAFVKEKT